MDSNLNPVKVVMRRVKTPIISGKHAKHCFLVLFGGAIQDFYMYFEDSNLPHNIIRDLKKTLGLTNREMHQKLFSKEVVVYVEFSEHIAFRITYTNNKFEASHWEFCDVWCFCYATTEKP